MSPDQKSSEKFFQEDDAATAPPPAPSFSQTSKQTRPQPPANHPRGAFLAPTYPQQTKYISIVPKLPQTSVPSRSKDDVVARDIPVPAVFQGRPRRQGNWPPQEQEYASSLIKAFKSGQLEDCRDGVTLRNYLSAKLHCSGMRVCKKFSGQSFGTMDYRHRAKEEGASRSLIQEQERLFYQAVVTPSAAYFPLTAGMLPRQPPSTMLQGNTTGISPVATPSVPPQATLPVKAVAAPPSTPSLLQHSVLVGQLPTFPRLNPVQATIRESATGRVPDAPSCGPFASTLKPAEHDDKRPVCFADAFAEDESEYDLATYHSRLTSRSFDDLHRFLGRESMSLPEDDEVDDTQEAPPVDDDAICNIDSFPGSYLLFVQETALAASQHAAYQQVVTKTGSGDALEATHRSLGKDAQERLKEEPWGVAKVAHFHRVDQVVLQQHDTATRVDELVGTNRLVSEASSSVGQISGRNSSSGKEESTSSDCGDSDEAGTDAIVEPAQKRCRVDELGASAVNLSDK